MRGYYGGGDFLFGGIIHILVFALVIIIIVAVLRRLGGRHQFWHKMHDGSMKNSALDILRERFAKGEINKEEFEEKKKLLS